MDAYKDESVNIGYNTSIFIEHYGDKKQEDNSTIIASSGLTVDNQKQKSEEISPIKIGARQLDAVFFSDEIAATQAFFIDPSKQIANHQNNKLFEGDCTQPDEPPENHRQESNSNCINKSNNICEYEIIHIDQGSSGAPTLPPPPRYNSLVEWILNDPPPEYGEVTGVTVNVDEVSITHFPSHQKMLKR